MIRMLKGQSYSNTYVYKKIKFHCIVCLTNGLVANPGYKENERGIFLTHLQSNLPAMRTRLASAPLTHNIRILIISFNKVFLHGGDGAVEFEYLLGNLN